MSAQPAEARAARIAEAAAEAWYQAQGSSDYATAVGVVAALALVERADPSGPDPARMIIESSDEEIARTLTQIWSLFRMARPDLARLTGPLANWVNDGNPVTGNVHAIASVARAAAENGLLDLAGSGSLRDTDVLGVMYQQMRSRSGAAREWARGEFPTPPDVCKAMAAMSLGGADSLRPGAAIAAGPAGTGEMLHAAAQHIREQGMDPAGFRWIANGISPAAAAVTAVNCHLWGLGPHVVIGVAHPVTEPGWTERASAEQQAAIAHRDDAAPAETTHAAAGRKQAPLKSGPAVPSASPDKSQPDAPGNSAGQRAPGKRSRPGAAAPAPARKRGAR